jgi:hypothetical protein
MVWNVKKHAEIDLFYFRNAKVVGSTPIIGTIIKLFPSLPKSTQSPFTEASGSFLSLVIN